ncbi:MAG: alpha/beta hydrolase [Chloroflexi bacterium]|nr:alpha/beta hydrolase [Chloroflexota bacterium]
MEYASRYISANRIYHRFLEWGDTGKPPVIMMHATGLSAHSWLPIAEGLATGYHVLALDQRGHGDTDLSDVGYSFELVGQDLAAVIKALELPSVRIVGHSSGGLATLIAAHLTPGKITQACLVETRVGERPANAPPGELQDRARRTRQKRMVWESREAMQGAYRQRAAFKDWDLRAYQAFTEGGSRLLSDGRAELKCPPEVEALFYEKRESLQVTPFFRGLTGRFLLLLGSYPEAQTPSDTGVQRFLSEVDYSEAKPMGMGSHFLPMEHPAEVLREIKAFFDSED